MLTAASICSVATNYKKDEAKAKEGKKKDFCVRLIHLSLYNVTNDCIDLAERGFVNFFKLSFRVTLSEVISSK